VITANDVQCAQSDEQVNVEVLIDFLAQLIDEYGTLFIDDVNQLLQNLKVESWCQQFMRLWCHFAPVIAEK
jgi:hypothetical protein